MSLPICGRQSTTRPFRFGFGCYFSTLKYGGPRHFSKLKRFPYKKADGERSRPKQGRGAGRRGEGTRVRPYPTSHPPTAGKPPHSEDKWAFRVPHPRPIHAKHSNQHTAKLTAYHCPTSPLTQGPSHSQIDGRRQAAHPTREESVMAGSMQVPSMAMCGIDGIERPLHPSQSERAFDSDLNIQIRSKCTCSLGASKAVVQNRINCTHLGRHFPVRGVRGTSRRVQPPRKPGKPFQCDARGRRPRACGHCATGKPSPNRTRP